MPSNLLQALLAYSQFSIWVPHFYWWFHLAKPISQVSDHFPLEIAEVEFSTYHILVSFDQRFNIHRSYLQYSLWTASHLTLSVADFPTSVLIAPFHKTLLFTLSHRWGHLPPVELSVAPRSTLVITFGTHRKTTCNSLPQEPAHLAFSPCLALFEQGGRGIACFCSRASWFERSCLQVGTRIWA